MIIAKEKFTQLEDREIQIADKYGVILEEETTNIVDVKSLKYPEPYEIHQTYQSTKLYIVTKYTFIF